jgi:hypothetical protein
MTSPKEKADNLAIKFLHGIAIEFNPTENQIKERDAIVKKCALIAVENEYHSLREQLFNLRSCRVIENEQTYLKRIDQLIEEEKQVKQEIERL